MSVSHYAYCGPFVSCEVTYKTIKQVRKGCCNQACKRYHSLSESNFCSECGHSNKTWDEEKRKRTVDSWEVFGDDQSLNCVDVGKNDFDVYIPNAGRPQPRQFRYTPRYGSACVNLTDSKLSEAERAWLSEAYKEEIEALQRAYGEKSVHICWGFLIWAN